MEIRYPSLNSLQNEMNLAENFLKQHVDYQSYQNELYCLQDAKSSQVLICPKLIQHGIYKQNNREQYYIIFKKFGQSLHEYIDQQNQIQSIQESAKIGMQLVRKIQLLHDRGIIHTQINLKNICKVQEDDRKFCDSLIFFINFEEVTPYVNSENIHITQSIYKQNIKDLHFQSKNQYFLESPSRRDDLIQILYTMMYMIRGWLPWKDCLSDKWAYQQNFRSLQKFHSNIELNSLFSNELIFLKDIAEHLYGLQYEGKPNYQMIIEKLEKISRLTDLEVTEQIKQNQEEMKNRYSKIRLHNLQKMIAANMDSSLYEELEIETKQIVDKITNSLEAKEQKKYYNSEEYKQAKQIKQRLIQLKKQFRSHYNQKLIQQRKQCQKQILLQNIDQFIYDMTQYSIDQISNEIEKIEVKKHLFQSKYSQFNQEVCEQDSDFDFSDFDQNCQDDDLLDEFYQEDIEVVRIQQFKNFIQDTKKNYSNNI